MDGDRPPAPEVQHENDHMKDPMVKVFSNVLLREFILEKIINEIEGGKLTKQILDLREVSKTFLASVSHVVKKLRLQGKIVDLRPFTPLMVKVNDDVEVEEEEEDNEDDQTESDDEYEDEEDKREILPKVVDIFSSPDRLVPISVLPISLVLDGNSYFNWEGSGEVLTKFLMIEGCFTNLVEFHICFPKDMKNFPKFQFESMRILLPNLLDFSVRGLEKGGLDTVKLTFIQNVLNGTEKLKTFRLRGRFTPPPDNVFPGELPGLLRLPSTLDELYLETTLTSVQLQEILLVRNPLVNLTTLKICVPQPFSEKDVLILEKILWKFQETLEVLNIQGWEKESVPASVVSVNIRLPVMKNVHTLVIAGVSWAWTSANKGVSLVNCFPVLKALHLDRHNDMAWSHFMEWGTLESVTSFMTTVRRPSQHVGENEDEEEGDEEEEIDDLEPIDALDDGRFYCANLTVLQVNKLCERFPNLQSLEAPIDQFGFPVLFREMRQLKTLKIHVAISNLTQNTARWNQALLGIPVEETRRLTELLCKFTDYTGASWAENYKLRREEVGLTILDMTELTHLKLASDMTPLILSERLLTNLVFFQGLMKMENLKTLECHGGFKPTQKMVDKWTETHGDTITYTSEYVEDYDNHDDDFIQNF